MCGKFTQKVSWSEVLDVPQLVESASADAAVATVTPMRFANILRLDADGKREVAPMRWGFARRGATTPARPDHIHARAETIDKKPTFAGAFASSRGILLVSTFNEGEELANGKVKQWVITPKDGRPIAIAVICEEWVNGEERLPTFVMVTSPPNALLAQISDRMPAVLREEDWPTWLGETDASLDKVKAVLHAYDDGGVWEMSPQQPKPKGPDAQGDLF